MGECRLLPGATYSNPKARGSYDSKGAARLGIDELEMYFSHQILGVYHHTVHSALGVTPMQAWTEKAAGRAINRPDDMDGFRLDLLPECERVVTRQGIKAFSDQYYSQELGEAYINGARQVRVKYDPRNLSQIYVRDQRGGYLTVPYRLRRDGPPPSLWLLQAARRSLNQAGPTEHDRTTTRRAIEAAERIIAQAAPKSSAAARQLERLSRNRAAAAALRPSTEKPCVPSSDWGGVFGEEES